MKLKDVLEGIEVLESNADMNAEISGISYDSRRTQPNDLFVAVVGYESDGHKFIASAANNGACCVLCEKKPDTDIPYVLIENTRRGLAQVSANWFGKPAESMKIIGVTGTNGKTTTTHLIKNLLERCLSVKVGLIGTNHNMVGSEIIHTEHTTPESYELQELFRQMADGGCQYVVMEVSSHALYLDRVYGVTFEAAVFTNLTRDHLDFHKTMEEYCAAKAKIFAHTKHAIINLDDEYSQSMINAAECPVHTFSTENNTADLVSKRVRLHPESVDFCALTMESLETVTLGIPGMFSVYNALAALETMMVLGVPIAKAAEEISGCPGVMGRAEVVPTGKDFTVLIDYAHTPDALQNIIETVRETAKGRVVTLFGCGGDRDKTKRPIMGDIGVNLSDFAIVTSDNPRTEEPGEIIKDILIGIKKTKKPYKVIENRREAIKWAVQNAQPNDVIILAGKGHETYQILGKEKTHFDEREVVAQALSEM